MEKSKPLVSIIIPNFNYSRYLDKAIMSAVEQSYPNKEIILLDNQSSDNSVFIARKYEKYGVRVWRNQVNIMTHSYDILAAMSRGKYFIMPGSDDYILPGFIEKAVNILEEYPDVGYVHGERDIITGNDEIIELEPFYTCSFVAPGKNVMPIYMVTTVAHAVQSVIRTEAFRSVGGYDMEINHMSVDRSLWYYLSYEWDAAYIREKSAMLRMAQGTETFITQQNFQHPILCHLIVKDFVKFAKEKNLLNVLAREEEALKRLAREFVGYSAGNIYHNNFSGAKRYLQYAKVLDRNIPEEDLFKHCEEMVRNNVINSTVIDSVRRQEFRHKRNYDPPLGYKEIVTI